MANIIQIKHGSGDPTGKLQNYELGYRDDTGALYINNGTNTVQLTGLAATGLVGTNNYLKLPKVDSTTSNTGRILVVDNDIVYYKTPANILSEIGALSTGGGTISGNLVANGAIIVKDGVSYGKTNPNTANNGQPISGTVGQLYFVVAG